MSYRRMPLSVALFISMLWICHRKCAFAEPSPAKEKIPSRASQFVQQALDNELAGDSAARKELLQKALALDPQFPPARWHLGHIRSGDGWLPAAEAMARATDGELTAQYQSKRTAALDNAALELNLAQWCVKNDMSDRARLHYFRVITNAKASDGQVKDAARQLDLVSVGGVILTRDELKKEQEREKRIAEAIGKYRPILAQLQPAIDGEFGENRDAAVAKLAAIDDPAVIPAIDTYLSDHREGFGEELVKLLGKFAQHESTQTLARLAVLSPFLGVRERAVAALRERPLHDYVPTLLAGLASPIQSQFRYSIDRQGNVSFQQIYAQEGAKAVAVSSQHVRLRPVTVRTGSTQTKVIPRTEQFPPPPEVYMRQFSFPPELALLELSLIFAAQHLEANQRNDAVTQLNRRIVRVLKDVTGQQGFEKPQEWWSWWQEYNQVHFPKPTYYAFSSQQSYYLRSMQSTDIYQTIRQGGSCFLAGTPVWTESGVRPIESIQPGDRVLSKDPDTGELCFKVVIGKTLRPPTEASKLTVNGEAITTTLGHPLWVTGKGWEMAKHVKAGDQLHGIGGIVNINAIEPLPNKVEAHNLVVDDFNTYFVGNCGMLVHDNTYRKPTRAIVPGLVP